MAPTAARLILATALAAGAAYEPTLDRRAIEEAIVIGQSRVERTRTRFHDPYRLEIGRAPIDYLDVITPFRQVVLAAEASARRGDRLFGQQEALAVLAEGGNEIVLVVETTFHPLNAYVAVPEYDVVLEPSGSPAVEPRTIERVPRFGPRVEGLPLPYPYPAPGIPDAGQPLLGATVIARIDGRLLDPAGAYQAVITEAGRELARTRVDLERLR